MLIYALPDMTLVGRSPLPGQGWGATHDDQALWFSDGSDQLYSRVVSEEGLGQNHHPLGHDERRTAAQS